MAVVVENGCAGAAERGEANIYPFCLADPRSQHLNQRSQSRAAKHARIANAGSINRESTLLESRMQRKLARPVWGQVRRVIVHLGHSSIDSKWYAHRGHIRIAGNPRPVGYPLGENTRSQPTPRQVRLHALGRAILVTYSEAKFLA